MSIKLYISLKYTFFMYIYLLTLSFSFKQSISGKCSKIKQTFKPKYFYCTILRLENSK